MRRSAADRVPAVRPGWLQRSRGMKGAPFAYLAVLIVLALLPLVMNLYLQEVGFEILELAMLAQAWNLLGGYGGLVSLGTAAFVGIGEYAVAVLTTWMNVPLVPAIALGGLAAALFAAIVSAPMLRMRGVYFTIGTLALTEALSIFMLNWNGLEGSQGIYLNVAALDPTQLYYILLGGTAVATAVVGLVMRAPFGLALRSVRDNEDVAQEMGVPTFWTKFGAFVISSGIMGIVGGLQAVYLGQVEPTGAFSLLWTINTVNIAIIGGGGTLLGPLVGALFIGGLGQLLANYSDIHLAISGAILIIVVRFAPRGIWGLVLRLVPGARRTVQGGADHVA